MIARSFNADVFLSRLWAMDAVLARAGFPPTSAWWRRVIERFFRGRMSLATLRRLVLRVGRRGGKSTTLCRVGVAWLLYGQWTVPPGDVGVLAVLSVSISESTSKTRTFEAIFNALHVRYRRTKDGLELADRPGMVKCFAATTTAVVGFTAIAILADEVAAWWSDDANSNPAGEVFSYLSPTLATQPWGFQVLLSSPRSTGDYHYETFERGDTADQQVAEAPTWVANPTLSEEHTRALEPDARIWAREYAAIPQPSVLGAFDASAIERAFEARSAPTLDYQRVLVMDASSGKKDAFTGGIAGWSVIDGRAHLVVDALEGVDGSFWQQMRGDQVVDRFAAFAKRHGATVVHADQRESLMLAAEFQRHGLTFAEHAWTSANKPKAVELVRRWLAEGTLVLPEHAKLRRELLAFEERITPAGNFTFAARGGGHDDYVALLITAALAELEGALIGSPLHGGGTFERKWNSYLPGFRLAGSGSHFSQPIAVLRASDGMGFCVRSADEDDDPIVQADERRETIG